MLDVFGAIDLSYYITDQKTKSKSEWFWVREMTEKIMIETRPRFPSDKLSLTIADITKDKLIRYFCIYLKNGQFDLNVILEDSQRNFLS